MLIRYLVIHVPNTRDTRSTKVAWDEPFNVGSFGSIDENLLARDCFSRDGADQNVNPGENLVQLVGAIVLPI